MKAELLDQFMPRPFGKAKRGDTKKLEAFEALIGARLPPAYVSLLLKYGATICFDRGVRFKPAKPSPWDSRKDGTQSLELLCGLDAGKRSLTQQYRVYKDRMPHGVIPIGEAPGGNIIVLTTQGDSSGSIYLWDHENERLMTGNLKNDYGNTYLIAKSFESFLHSLEVEPEEPLQEDDDGIVDFWLDDELKP